MNANTFGNLAQFTALSKQSMSVASHSERASIMALQVGKLRDPGAKRRQVKLLCSTLLCVLEEVK